MKSTVESKTPYLTAVIERLDEACPADQQRDVVTQAMERANADILEVGFYDSCLLALGIGGPSPAGKSRLAVLESQLHVWLPQFLYANSGEHIRSSSLTEVYQRLCKRSIPDIALALYDMHTTGGHGKHSLAYEPPGLAGLVIEPGPNKLQAVFLGTLHQQVKVCAMLGPVMLFTGFREQSPGFLQRVLELTVEQTEKEPGESPAEHGQRMVDFFHNTLGMPNIAKRWLTRSVLLVQILDGLEQPHEVLQMRDALTTALFACYKFWNARPKEAQSVAHQILPAEARTTGTAAIWHAQGVMSRGILGLDLDEVSAKLTALINEKVDQVLASLALPGREALNFRWYLDKPSLKHDFFGVDAPLERPAARQFEWVISKLICFGTGRGNSAAVEVVRTTAAPFNCEIPDALRNFNEALTSLQLEHLKSKDLGWTAVDEDVFLQLSPQPGPLHPGGSANLPIRAQSGFIRRGDGKVLAQVELYQVPRA